MGKEEGLIQAAIKEYLERLGYWVIRVQCGQVLVRGGVMHLARPGTSDLITWLPGTGRLFCIETKTPEGKLSKEQREFRAKVENEGGLYCCAMCIEDVQRKLKEVKN